jgi:two-component system response regulator FixJ
MTTVTTHPLSTSKLYLLDDDPRVRETLRRFGETNGVEFSHCRSAAELIHCYAPATPSCLVIGIRPPGDSELALVESIHARRDPVAVIAMGAKVAVSLVVRAMKSGVQNFLERPPMDYELVGNVSTALQQARRDAATLRQWTEFERRLAELTDRQREILHHIVLGKANKVIAYDLGISERTVEVHRHRLLQRMSVRSAVELARLTGEFRASQLSVACSCGETTRSNGHVYRQPFDSSVTLSGAIDLS